LKCIVYIPMQFLSKRKARKLSGEETGSFLQIAVNPVESIPTPMKQDRRKGNLLSSSGSPQICTHIGCT
jgi:hypothetical protein